MSLNGNDLSTISSGWYENGIRIRDMKKDEVYKNFNIYNVFYENEYEKEEQLK